MDMESSKLVFGSTDLLVHILEYIHEPADRDAVSRVCKDWCTAFQSVPQRLAFRRGEDVRLSRWQSSPVSSLTLLRLLLDQAPEALQAASANYASSLRRLKLQCQMQPSHLPAISRFKNLVTLTLDQVSLTTPADILPLASVCPFLEELSIFYEDYPISPWTINGGHAFRKLFAEEWQLVRDQDIEGLTKHCPNLRTLELKNCRALGDAAMKALPNARKLQSLRLTGTFDMTISGVASLGECASLEHLTLDLKRNVVDRGVDLPYSSIPFDLADTLFEIARLPLLKQLELGTYLQAQRLPASWNALEALAMSLPLLTKVIKDVKPFAKACTTLRQLEIRSDPHASPWNDEGGEALKRIGWAGFPSLEKLSIQSDKVDSFAVEALSNCPNLASLWLSSTAVTSRGIAHLAARTQKLTELSLTSNRETRGVSDEGLQAIAQAAPALRRLELARCPAVTDIGFASLATCSQLTVLSLNHTPIGDVGLITLVKALPGLRDVGLMGCQNITNLTPVTWLPNLESLNLSACENAVTDDLVGGLVERCKKLRTLYLDSCKRLSEEAFFFLSESRSLRVLSVRDCMDVNTGLALLAMSSTNWLTQVVISGDVPHLRGVEMLKSRGVLNVV